MDAPQDTIDRLGAAAGRYLRRAEREVVRRAYSFGNQVSCPICGWTGWRFAASSKPRVSNRICPECTSNERYRALECWLRSQHWTEGSRLLEIAPLGLLEPTARELGFRYSSLDLKSPKARVRGDLCSLPFASGSFDLIVCFHVLEHIPDDRSAVCEIARTLDERGQAIIVVPWERHLESTFEDPDARPQDYERLYKQSDHVRSYGRDVSDRLSDGGLDVSEILWADVFPRETFERLALDNDDDRFWVCTRTAR